MLGQKEIIVNAKGVIGGLRQKSNGLAYFGKEAFDNKGKPINDFIVNLKDEILSNSIFLIYYRRDNSKYYLRMLESNSKIFCFASLVSPLALRTGTIISVFNHNYKFTVNDDSTLTVDYEMEGGKLLTK